MRNIRAAAALALALTASTPSRTIAETRRWWRARCSTGAGPGASGSARAIAGLDHVELPVLDLKTEAGGLTPLREVGSMQTVGLAFKGADGTAYTFRKLMKASERTLPSQWLRTPMEAILRDQTSAAHPAAPVIAGGLAALGIEFYGSRVMVMPDDPALGKVPGRPSGTRWGRSMNTSGPGMRGITEVISTADLWKKWLAGGPESRVDTRAFLKARLFDLVVGNWDRHQQQWRWARLPGNPSWEPLPEDADQAFTRYEGKALGYSGGHPPPLHALLGRIPEAHRRPHSQQRGSW